MLPELSDLKNDHQMTCEECDCAQSYPWKESSMIHICPGMAKHKRGILCPHIAQHKKLCQCKHWREKRKRNRKNSETKSTVSVSKWDPNRQKVKKNTDCNRTTTTVLCYPIKISILFNWLCVWISVKKMAQHLSFNSFLCTFGNWKKAPPWPITSTSLAQFQKSGKAGKRWKTLH